MIRFLKVLALVSLMLTLTAPVVAEDSPQFRGPDRDGIYEATGLLTTWPAEGPKRLWTAKGLGDGFATVSVADGRLYTTGLHDDQGSVFAFDTSGKMLWKKVYGAEHPGGGYPGTRTTPTVDGDSLYLMSSTGLAPGPKPYSLE